MILKCVQSIFHSSYCIVFITYIEDPHEDFIYLAVTVTFLAAWLGLCLAFACSSFHISLVSRKRFFHEGKKKYFTTFQIFAAFAARSVTNAHALPVK